MGKQRRRVAGRRDYDDEREKMRLRYYSVLGIKMPRTKKEKNKAAKNPAVGLYHR